MKKFLSLVLALVMTMSLVTVSAGAKDFTDSSKITYSEAVDVMSAVKVIDGYAEGDFRPTATLSGNAFMKMLLGALGYDSSIEGYTGANWSIAVAKQAINAGLNKSLKGSFNGVKAVSAQIFDEGGLILDVGFIDAQLFSNNLLDPGFDIFFHLNLRDQIKNFCDVERFGTFLIDTRFHAGSIILIIAELYKTSGKNFQRG